MSQHPPNLIHHTGPLRNGNFAPTNAPALAQGQPIGQPISGPHQHPHPYRVEGQLAFAPAPYNGLPYYTHGPNPNMTYPPPPPPPSHPPADNRNSAGYDNGLHRYAMQPNAGQHQQYDPRYASHPNEAINHRRSNPDMQQDAKRPRVDMRRPSDEEEREAGLALAGLGLSLTPTLSADATHGDSEHEGQDKKPTIKSTNKKGGRISDTGKARNACKECRRLKSKCDKQIPCSTCVGRGCAGICPDGSMAKMQGKRLVISGTTELHDRISKLEAALAHAHNKLSSDTHPLLGPEHLDGGNASISPPLRVPALSHSDSSPDTHPPSLRVVTPIANLTERGLSSHPRMAVESLLLSDDSAVPEGRKDAEWVGENAAPAFIIGMAMPAEPEKREKILHKLLDLHSILPPREETQRRAKRYFAACHWFTNILRPAEFDSSYEPAVYEPSAANPLSPHKLACVFMVLVLDTFLDITSDEDDPTIAKYWEAAQQCFDTRFGWAGSVAGIQGLALATYFVTFGWRGARASNYYWLRQTTSAILQLGLHKDPHHSLPLVEKDLKRRVFWEAFSMDALLSINHGQKPAIYVDTVETIEPTDASDVQKTKYSYMREVKLSVLDIGCRPDSAPASQEQLQATHDILKRYEPDSYPHLHCPVLCGHPMPPVTTDPSRLDIWKIHLAMSSMCHYKAYLFLFRPSLRRLLGRIRSHYPEAVVLDDNDRSVVTATFDACRAITLISKYMTRTHPRLAVRLWSTWVQTFSAAVSMAALAIWCGTYMDPNFIPSAYQELCDACDLIRENRSHRSSNVETLLPILQSIVADRYPYLVSRSDPPHIQPDKEDTLFALLGGRIEKPTFPVTQPGSKQQQSQTAIVPGDMSRAIPHSQIQDFGADAFQASLQQQQQTQNLEQNQHSFWQTQHNLTPQTIAFGQPNAAQVEFDPATISAMELWNRFQSFYEPTPVSWGAGLGGETTQGGMTGGPYDGMFGLTG